MNTELLQLCVFMMSLGNFDIYNSLGPMWQQTLRFALIKYGGGIVQMSGSVAGNTHARNRFGNYMRARTKPVNPKSARQMGARIAVMAMAEQWRESPMTDAFRTAWQTYANSVSWLNKLGETVTLTGFNMFIRGQTALLRVGAANVWPGPTDLGLPGADEDFAVTASVAANKLSVSFEDDVGWCDEDGAYLAVDMGVPQNPTRNFFAGPWRFAGSIAGAVGVDPTSPQPIDPPFTLIEGQKVWCRAHVIRADARVSTKFNAEPLIVAA